MTNELPGLVHDLNNAITPFFGWVDLARGAKTEAEIRQALEKASANAPRCLGLLSQIRATIARTSENAPACCAPGEVIGRTLDAFSTNLPPQVRLIRNLWPRLLSVAMSADYVDRVVFNLAGNAKDAIVQASRPRGIITVTAHNAWVRENLSATLGLQPGRYVLVTVKDDGSGISPANQARLFEPYFTTKEAGKGTGLGLATVRDLLVQSGGSITFKSAPGKTRFNVFFPVRLD